MPKDTNELSDHNRHFIDKAAREFIELAARAVTAEPHGSLTLKLEWRACGAHRIVLTEERSSMCLPLPAGENT